MRAMQVKIRQLRALDAIVRMGSFVEAARALHVTPAALSLAIRELEDRLGFAVLERTTRSVRLSARAKQLLLEYHWPGNVRELEHLMSRAALLAKAGHNGAQRWITIDAEHLGLRAETAPDNAAALEQTAALSLAQATENFQRDWLKAVLARHRGNLAAAARDAGVDRSNFHRLLKRLGLRD